MNESKKPQPQNRAPDADDLWSLSSVRSVYGDVARGAGLVRMLWGVSTFFRQTTSFKMVRPHDLHTPMLGRVIFAATLERRL